MKFEGIGVEGHTLYESYPEFEGEFNETVIGVLRVMVEVLGLGEVCTLFDSI